MPSLERAAVTAAAACARPAAATPSIPRATTTRRRPQRRLASATPALVIDAFPDTSSRRRRVGLGSARARHGARMSSRDGSIQATESEQRAGSRAHSLTRRPGTSSSEFETSKSMREGAARQTRNTATDSATRPRASRRRNAVTERAARSRLLAEAPPPAAAPRSKQTMEAAAASSPCALIAPCQ